MPEPVIFPYVPRSITVHLGAPNASAANVTVPFPDYVKNVVSSEIYPTWEPSALRANTLAIISYALNRVYTDYYRSRLTKFSTTIFEDKAPSSRLPQNSATARPSPAPGSASGAASITRSTAQTAWKSCAHITERMWRSWTTRPLRTSARPIPGSLCASARPAPL